MVILTLVIYIINLKAALMIKAVDLFKVSNQIRKIFVISQAEIKLNLVFEDLPYVKTEI